MFITIAISYDSLITIFSSIRFSTNFDYFSYILFVFFYNKNVDSSKCTIIPYYKQLFIIKTIDIVTQSLKYNLLEGLEIDYLKIQISKYQKIIDC